MDINHLSHPDQEAVHHQNPHLASLKGSGTSSSTTGQNIGRIQGNEIVKKMKILGSRLSCPSVPTSTQQYSESVQSHQQNQYKRVVSASPESERAKQAQPAGNGCGSKPRSELQTRILAPSPKHLHKHKPNRSLHFTSQSLNESMQRNLSSAMMMPAHDTRGRKNPLKRLALSVQGQSTGPTTTKTAKSQSLSPPPPKTNNEILSYFKSYQSIQVSSANKQQPQINAKQASKILTRPDTLEKRKAAQSSSRERSKGPTLDHPKIKVRESLSRDKKVKPHDHNPSRPLSSKRRGHTFKNLSSPTSLSKKDTFLLPGSTVSSQHHRPHSRILSSFIEPNQKIQKKKSRSSSAKRAALAKNNNNKFDMKQQQRQQQQLAKQNVHHFASDHTTQGFVQQVLGSVAAAVAAQSNGGTAAGNGQPIFSQNSSATNAATQAAILGMHQPSISNSKKSSTSKKGIGQQRNSQAVGPSPFAINAAGLGSDQLLMMNVLQQPRASHQVSSYNSHSQAAAHQHFIQQVNSLTSSTASNAGAGSKKANGQPQNLMMVDTSAYKSQPAPLTATASKSNKGGAVSLGKGGSSSTGKQSNSGAATTKHSQGKTSSVNGHMGVGVGNWKFVERRLSAKVLQGGGHNTATEGNNTHLSKKSQSKPLTSTTAGPIQYENLMLQQLLKQQKVEGGSQFKKNLSMIQIEQSGAPLNQQLPPAPQPHMMLNISYNMNNNIDANSAAQFVFHQQPPCATQPNPASDPVQQNLQSLAVVHHPLTNQQQQQIRTIIGLATNGASAALPEGHHTTASAAVGMEQHPLHLLTGGGGPSSYATEMAAAAGVAQYKTQVDQKQKGIKPGPAGNPYNTNASSSMLGEGMMTYENSIAQVLKKDQMSFDQIKRKRRSLNSGQQRSKQLSSGNSGRRAAMLSNKSSSQPPNISNVPQSRSTSSKRGVASKQLPQSKGESSRGIGAMHPASSHSNASHNNQPIGFHHPQAKKNAQKKSLDQAKLKVKGSYSQPPDLQNQRGSLKVAATIPSGGPPKSATQIQNFQHQTQQQQSHSFNQGGVGISSSTMITENDKYLLSKLDEALARDLTDKSSSQRVAICSKVWAEIIRRQDLVISSLLTKIKQNYEGHIKNQNKLLAQQQKDLLGPLEEEVKTEKEARKAAEEKVEALSGEVLIIQQQSQKQEEIIAEMKKQILAYRREIIEISSSKKYYGQGGGHGNQQQQHHQNSKSEGRRVPRLDLSKLQRDSENEGDQESSLEHQAEDNQDGGKNVTYQQYLKFLENEDRFNKVPNAGAVGVQQLPTGSDQLIMGEESQESIMRQEELKQRKNKIIQLLNGDISEEEGGMDDDEDEDEEGQEEEEDDEEEGIDIDFHHHMVRGQQQLHNREDLQLTAEEEDFDNYHIIKQQQVPVHIGGQQVTSNDEEDFEAADFDPLSKGKQPRFNQVAIDVGQAVEKAAKSRGYYEQPSGQWVGDSNHIHDPAAIQQQIDNLGSEYIEDFNEDNLIDDEVQNILAHARQNIGAGNGGARMSQEGHLAGNKARHNKSFS